MKRANLKIGFVFDDSLDINDGVAQQVKILGSYFNSQGHHVRYLVGQTNIKSWQGDKVYSLSSNVKVSFNANKLSIPLPADKKQIKKVLSDEKFDILHVQMPHSPLMAGRVIKAAHKNTVIIGTFHIMPSGRISVWGSHILRMLYGNSLSWFDYIASVSKPAAIFAHQAFGIKSAVIPNTIYTQKFFIDKDKLAKNSAQRIVYLNRLVERKGCKQLIEAFAVLLKTLPTTQLLIASDGSERPKLERLVRRLGISENVKFLGFVKESEKPQLFASADVACFPSLYGESFGVVLLEAMAAGSQVILGGNNPGYTSVLSEQPILLIDPNDTVSFARRLERLLTEKATIQGLHAWQTEHVKQYDIEIIGLKYLQIYNSAIANSKKNRHN
jgi:phosphatidylinositol alpha-mannosyltransferase